MHQTSFGILHLTDLHAGQRQHRNLYPHMCRAFFSDLAKCYDNCGPWDVVVFSGDLAFSGTEYRLVDEFLDHLYDKLKELGGNPFFVAVPGNHDLSRPTRLNSDVMMLTSLSNLPKKQADRYWEGFVNDSTSDGRRAVESVFTGYSKWWARARKKYNPTKFDSFTAGLLPGEFAARIKKNSRSLALVGLNSTFMQLYDNRFRGKLQMHVQQLNTVLAGDLDVLKAVDAAVLITHHPPDWLQKRNQTDTFFPPDRLVGLVCRAPVRPFARCQKRNKRLGWFEFETALPGPLVIGNGTNVSRSPASDRISGVSDQSRCISRRRRALLATQGYRLGIE